MNKTSFNRTHRALRWSAAAAVLMFSVNACSNDDVNAPASVATSITYNTDPTALSATAGSALANPVRVTVLDQNGKPMSNVTVNWQVMTGGGSVAQLSSNTDESGVATVAWTLGRATGPQTLKASIEGGVGAVTITANAVAGAPSTISVASGNNQSIRAGTLSAPLVVKVVDQFGNPVPAQTVTWSTNRGTLANSSSVTNFEGTAEMTLTAAQTAGSHTVTATVNGQTVTFTLTGT